MVHYPKHFHSRWFPMSHLIPPLLPSSYSSYFHTHTTNCILLFTYIIHHHTTCTLPFTHYSTCTIIHHPLQTIYEYIHASFVISGFSALSHIAPISFYDLDPIICIVRQMTSFRGFVYKRNQIMEYWCVG